MCASDLTETMDFYVKKNINSIYKGIFSKLHILHTCKYSPYRSSLAYYEIHEERLHMYIIILVGNSRPT